MQTTGQLRKACFPLFWVFSARCQVESEEQLRWPGLGE